MHTGRIRGGDQAFNERTGVGKAPEQSVERDDRHRRRAGHPDTKKIWGQAVEHLCEQEGLSVSTACKLFGHCRQAWYQQKESFEERCKKEAPIVEFARSIRAEDPGLGARKIWLMASDVYGARMMGRDAFYALLAREGLKLRRPRPRHTTNSSHRYHKYKNLIRGFVPLGPNLLWVSDITYIQLANGDCCYLHLVTDAYSHKVIGWCLSPSLEAKYTLGALREAIKQAEGYDLSKLIHHSDRSVQYCCNDYINELNSHHITISMTEDYKPTDNGIAERVNGIIKSEKLYRVPIYKTIEDAREGIGKFISFYNNRRPHMSIGNKTPAEAHQQSGPQKRLWKPNKPTSTILGRCQQN